MIPKEAKEFYTKHQKYMQHFPLIVGAIILLNVYLLKMSWFTVFGWLLVVGGVVKIIAHKYCCRIKKK